MLEALLAGEHALPEDVDIRVALYRILTLSLSPAGADLKSGTGDHDWEVAAGQRLASLPPAARQAFLLVAVEGFSIAEAAQVLDMDADKVRALIETATQDIAEQVSTSVLIIEGRADDRA